MVPCRMEQHQAWQGDVARKERISAQREVAKVERQPPGPPVAGITALWTVFWPRCPASRKSSRKSSLRSNRATPASGCFSSCRKHVLCKRRPLTFARSELFFYFMPFFFWRSAGLPQAGTIAANGPRSPVASRQSRPAASVQFGCLLCCPNSQR